MTLTQPLLHQVLYSGLLSLPIVIYINDCWFSIARVEGISMNPSLCDGDIVLVRKADFFPFFSTYRSSRIRVRDLTHEDELKQNQSIQVLQEVSDLQHALQVDKSIGKPPIHEMTWRKSPPMILPGDVVVFQNKYTFRPPELQIKRIIGIGGQNVRYGDDGRVKISTILPWNLWVEGDNTTSSIDSNTYGSISKKLVVGKVERILWPPSRMGKVEKIRPSAYKSWWT